MRSLTSMRGAALGLAVVAAMAMIVGGLVDSATAFASEPRNWQLGFQEAASPVKERMHSFHNMLLVIITAIAVFVMCLLAYTTIRYRAKANPVPSRVAHNTLIEVLWTVIPVLILVVIAVPSFRLLYFEDRAVDAEMTIKVIGHQWYWSYEYPDHGDIKFDSYMIQDADLKPGQKRLLEVDNRLVLPVGTTVRVLIAGTDVIHSFMVPSLGLQTYSMPGRLNETWVKIDHPGVFYGQCNQICGINHAYMPIAIEGVSKEAFKAWVEEAKKKFAAGEPSTHLATAAR